MTRPTQAQATTTPWPAATLALLLASACAPRTPVSEPATAASPNAPPAWVLEKQAALEGLGVDFIADLETRANYHWRWRPPGALTAGAYRCPPGSAVDVTRHLLLVIAFKRQTCVTGQGAETDIVKIYPDGTAEPLDPGA